MTYDEYVNTLSDESPPDDVHDLLKALWYDAKGDWSRAHAIAQDHTACRSWVVFR